jgi:hypothetical protein
MRISVQDDTLRSERIFSITLTRQEAVIASARVQIAHEPQTPVEVLGLLLEIARELENNDQKGIES